MKQKDYNPYQTEKKWQEIWAKEGTFCTSRDKNRTKYYTLVEFPYPSGEGLHVGHPRSYTALDVIARKRRLEGFNVLYAIGWDAFGLPTENFAIKHKVHPKAVTEQNINRYRQQLKRLGFSFDWSREINTTDPEYYRWTQWIFLQMYKHGLAYKAEIPINWCTSCKIGLANEEVVNGVCERCGGQIIRKVKSQWMLKITAYAERLIQDLDKVNYIEKVKIQQRNWIGRSEGVTIQFKLADHNRSIQVFTTRPDTLFGVTYMVLSPEHPLINELKDSIINWNEVKIYQDHVAHKSDFERTELSKEKTGVLLNGIKAINPASKKEIPIWISDYVLMTYGTGAIMAVPGHDIRDWEFAKKFNLPITEVIAGGNINKEAYTNISEGVLINSGFLNGFNVVDAREKIILWLEEQSIGTRQVNYKLRDWIFSRQHYWGEPIPLVHCSKCGWVPVPEDNLPVLLPEVEYYEPSETGDSPLAMIREWVETTCPNCGARAERETDTMPNWAGSSWYFLRYIDPHNNKIFADKETLDYWLPVDWYNGGMEHTTLHLLYSRFWYKFLYDCGLVPTSEPYQIRTSHGMILGENNEKMSKSRGNVVNPDDVVAKFGADTFRVYEMFIGAFEQATPWSEKGLKGCRRFLDRVWHLQDLLTNDIGFSVELETILHQSMRKVSEDIEQMKFNTAIATLMELVNKFYSRNKITKDEIKVFLILLNPFAPHITEEIWVINNLGGVLNKQNWIKWDNEKAKEDSMEIPIQINGKIKGTLVISKLETQDEIRANILADKSFTQYLADKKIIKEIYVPGKIYSFVTS